MEILRTPPQPVHRIMENLSWSRQDRGGRVKPPDGVTNRAKTMVKAAAKRSGVSFFEPDPTLFEAVHEEMRGLAGEGPICSITVPNVDLPANLGFTQDFDLKLAIGDDGAVVVCGRHWTLFTTVTQPIADFEAAYGSLQQTAMVPCTAAAAAEPQPLDIDDSCMPFDRLTYAVVVALEELADNSCCPNTRVFAWLYAKHLRAADMAFTDLLQTPAIANMAATALDAWVVRHPMFRAQAHEAQDLLITVLDDYTPSRPWYEPYWAVHPFQFLKGSFTDAMYEDQVRTCATAFADDAGLRDKVKATVTKLFDELHASRHQADMKVAKFVHSGITFEVRCGRSSSGSNSADWSHEDANSG